jgi:hypothetical protein
MRKSEQIEKWSVVQGRGSNEFQAAANFLDSEFGDRNANLYWTAELLNWKVGNKNPAGHGIVFTADLNGRTVGSVTLTLKRLFFDSKVYLVAEIGDTYTSAELLGKASRNKYVCNSEYVGHCQATEYVKGSIFGRLVVEVVDWAKSAGVQAIYGTPNKNSCAGYIKRLDFRLVNTGTNRVRLRVILTARLLQTKRWIPKIMAQFLGYGIHFLSQLQLLSSTLRLVKFRIDELEEAAGAEFDDLWERALSQRVASLVKDKNWLVWRYQTHPEVNYRIFTLRSQDVLHGWLVLRLDQSAARETITICDWLYKSDSTLWMAFMLKVLQSIRYQDAIVKLWSCDNSPFEKQLYRLFAISVRDVDVIFKPLGEGLKVFNHLNIFNEFSFGHGDNV